MNSQRFDYFFDLPPELREQILSYLCIVPGGVVVGPDVNEWNDFAGNNHLAATLPRGDAGRGRNEGRSKAQSKSNPRPPVNLFLASPVLYREAGDLYYGRNVFHLNLATGASWARKRRMRRLPRHHRSNSSSGSGSGSMIVGYSSEFGLTVTRSPVMRLLTEPDAAAARCRIASVVCHLVRFGEQAQGYLVPALGDMALVGRLRRVRVDLLGAPPGLRGGGGGNEGLMKKADLGGNPALRSLLVLLADPDLEKAELRVPKRFHAGFWCRFHHPLEGEESCAMMRGCQGEGEVGSGDRFGEFLKVDIRKLAEACGAQGPEFSIKKVGCD
ncbi:hypothetical protein N656DRAFT_780192 [Canariomyces notabilis]|uniref:F-box domain-containing protein n=1 Tax=Canariomyces notabilis TaxID=2074819 RepID=A0AAN6TCT2_9PEZI|nr:hypothetical protein N656DRAFT_780192 [Canariomyces arenarius]